MSQIIMTAHVPGLFRILAVQEALLHVAVKKRVIAAIAANKKFVHFFNEKSRIVMYNTLCGNSAFSLAFLRQAKKQS